MTGPLTPPPPPAPTSPPRPVSAAAKPATSTAGNARAEALKQRMLEKLRAEEAAAGGRGAASAQAAGKTENELLTEEMAKVNEFLAGQGYKYKVNDLDELSQLKNDAGIGGSSRPMDNLAPLQEKIPQLLGLGWLPRGGAGGSPDLDAGRCATYAAETRDELLAQNAALGDRAWPDGTKLKDRVTFEDCHKWERFTDGKPIYGESPAGLARRVIGGLGSGRLAGIFPGEHASVSGEGLKSAERSRVMRKFGVEVALALNSEGIEGMLSAEVAGSLLTEKELPDDIDINIRTAETDPTKAYVTNDLVRKFLEKFDGASVAVDDKTYAVQAYGGVRNAASLAYQRTYGYEVAAGEDKQVMRFDVEIKNVSGPAWSDHLKEDAEADPATANRGKRGPDAERQPGEGKRSARWLLLDNLKRTVSFRAQMADTVRTNPKVDKEQLIASVLDQTREKQFWETFRGALDRCAVKEGIYEADVFEWVKGQVTDEEAYVEAFNNSNKSKASFEDWLVRAIRDPG